MPDPRMINSGIYHCSFLYKKRVLILVPHADDELITTGMILPLLNKNQCEISIVYTTNGDYQGVNQGKVRLREALAYGKSQGVLVNNIIFMGFGDWGEREPHLYNSSEPLSSPSGKKETYALENHGTYAKQHYGFEVAYTRENYKKILKDILKDKRADFIFCMDCDIHGDHIALSLIFEEVITALIKEECYQPMVFKMFAHDMLWMGIEDSYSLNLGACRPVKDNPHGTYALKFQDAYYPWEDRIRFPIEPGYVSSFAVGNRFRKTMLYYKSQCVPYHFPRLLNSDQVFWSKRTDNLILFSEIWATSGDTKCFQTMKMFECNNVCKKQDLLEDSTMVWKPDINDKEKRLVFRFRQPVEINELVFYTGFHDNHIQDIIIRADNGFSMHTGEILKKYGKPNSYRLDQSITCNALEIQVIGTNVELIKMEAFFNKNRTLYFIKIMVNDNFIYKYNLIKREWKELKFRVYGYSNLGNTVLEPTDQELRWYIMGSNNKEYVENLQMYEPKELIGKKIGVESVHSSELFDEIEINIVPLYKRIFIIIYGKIEKTINKVVYKIIRLLK